MNRLTAPLGVLMAGVMVVGLAAPAQAEQTRTLICSERNIHTVYRLDAYAHYEIEGRYKRWTSFVFKVHGGRPSENHNNVNIELSEYGNVIFAHNSSDNLEYNRWYSVRPSSPVRTEVIIGDDIRDHRENATLSFHAIFDVANSSDPGCIAEGKFT